MSKNRGIGGHQSSVMESDEHLTPRFILDALDEFDLDPCASTIQPWKTANDVMTKYEDGLVSEWNGRVWCNPPYGLEAKKWLEKLYNHGDGIALIFARTDTNMFFDWVWNSADALLFIKGRLTFYDIYGTKRTTKSGKPSNSGAPSVLVAYGDFNVEILKNCEIVGKFIDLRNLNK